MKFDFGDRVLVNAQITRRQRGNRRWWERIALVQKQQRAIFLGYRTLANGDAEHDSEWDETKGHTYSLTDFHPKEYIKGALICIKGRNPEKVFLEDIELDHLGPQE